MCILKESKTMKKHHSDRHWWAEESLRKTGEWMCHDSAIAFPQDKQCRGGNTELDKAVQTCMDDLVRDIPPATDFCARDFTNVHYTRQRLLQHFGGCSHTNYIHFYLEENPSVEHWVRLYAAAIRCCITPCQRGFVFIDWSYAHPKGSGGWAHCTAMYFDIPQKRQTFIDPSCFLKKTELGDIMAYFRHHHVWLSDEDNPVLEVHRRGVSLYQCPPPEPS
jgi:hypothetical protein